MSEWISIKGRLPEVGTPVWALFMKKNGKPQRNPVREGEYGRWQYDDHLVGFVFGEYRNNMIEPEHCMKAGLTHWQPRQGPMPPPPLRTVAPVPEPRAEAGNTAIPRRSYIYRPGQREAAAERMREYWRRLKAGTSGQKFR